MLDAELLPRKIKGNVAFSQDKVERFPDKSDKHELKPPSSEAHIDLTRAVDATKPKPGVAMNKAGGKPPAQARAEEAKKREKVEKGRKEARDKYQVSKVFEDVASKVKGKKPPVPSVKRR